MWIRMVAWAVFLTGFYALGSLAIYRINAGWYYFQLMVLLPCAVVIYLVSGASKRARKYSLVARLFLGGVGSLIVGFGVVMVFDWLLRIRYWK
jgi:hypothetical protein